MPEFESIPWFRYTLLFKLVAFSSMHRISISASRSPIGAPPNANAPSPCPCTPTSPGPARSLQRRGMLALVGAPVLAPVLFGSMASATPLAPLGRIEKGGVKREGLSADEVKEILAKDIGERQYFVTGDLSTEIFDDQCRFKDPTNDVTGLSRYLAALKILFDPEVSGVQLVSIEVLNDRQVFARWRLGGYLKFPWNPRVEAFTGTATYTLSDRGLIVLQEETWDIQGSKALIDTFTPTFGPRQRVL